MNIEKKKAQATCAAIYSGLLSKDQVLVGIAKGIVKKITEWKKQHKDIDPSFEYLMQEYNNYPNFQEALLSKLKITRDDVEEVVNSLLQDIDKLTALPEANKTGRNEPCPCGSGKKYKKCCLALNK